MAVVADTLIKYRTRSKRKAPHAHAFMDFIDKKYIGAAFL